jgi:hypothetical protein
MMMSDFLLVLRDLLALGCLSQPSFETDRRGHAGLSASDIADLAAKEMLV